MVIPLMGVLGDAYEGGHADDPGKKTWDRPQTMSLHARALSEARGGLVTIDLWICGI